MMKTMTMTRLIVILLISWDRRSVPRRQRDGDGGVDFGYVFASGGYRHRDNRDRLGDDGAIEVLLNGRNVGLVCVGKGDDDETDSDTID